MMMIEIGKQGPRSLKKTPTLSPPDRDQYSNTLEISALHIFLLNTTWSSAVDHLRKYTINGQEGQHDLKDMLVTKLVDLI